MCASSRTVSTEQAAVMAVKSQFLFSASLYTEINENDKTPAWDGHFFLYGEKNGIVSYQGMVLAQVKGTEKVFPEKDTVSYSVEMEHLQHYANEMNGTMFFVVYIDPQTKKTKIFYKGLVPSETALLVESAAGQGEKTIHLSELPKDDGAACEQIIVRFYEKCRRDAKKSDKAQVYTANKLYADSFMEPLFLHRNKSGTRVMLKNLYIPLKCRYEYAERDVLGVIKEFLNATDDEKKKFLILEGDGGCGKTTLMAYLNYLREVKDSAAQELFGNRPLITIRLRDLDRKCLKDYKSLYKSICNYMKLEPDTRLEDLCPNAVVLLDGFDELCMIEGLTHASDHDELMTDLNRAVLGAFQFIVTSRHGYLSSNIKIPSIRCDILHMDQGQKDQWIERYTSADWCGETIEKSIWNYLGSSAAQGICDTPMTFYMMAAKPGMEKYLDNEWELFHHIFNVVLTQTEYNQMIRGSNPNDSHDIEKLQDVIYRVNEEIAYWMYQRGNTQLFIQDEDVKEIIKQLAKKEPQLKGLKKRQVVESCYALCGYWKTNTEKGAVEFLHNNIRDFFLAEKIYRMLQKVEDSTKDCGWEEAALEYARVLAALFPYGKLEGKTAEFFDLRLQWENLEWEKGKKESEKMPGWMSRAREQKWLMEILVQFSGDIMYDTALKKIAIKDINRLNTRLNAASRIESILWCSIGIFTLALKQFPAENTKVRLIPEGKEKNHVLEKMLFHIIGIGDSRRCLSDSQLYMEKRLHKTIWNFSGLTLVDWDLCGANLERADLSRAVLVGANLVGVNLKYAILAEADLKEVNLEEVKLFRAILNEAKLHKTKLSEAVMRGAELIQADLTEADLSHADLSSANLSGADLRKANLTGANLRNADFRRVSEVNWGGAKTAGLSLNKEGSIEERMAVMDFGGINSQNTDWTNRKRDDDRGSNQYMERSHYADCTRMRLNKKKVLGENFYGINLSGVDVVDTDLPGADLREAILSDANLSGAKLSGAILPDGFQSDDQDEQIAHLKSLNIPGLII